MNHFLDFVDKNIDDYEKELLYLLGYGNSIFNFFLLLEKKYLNSKNEIERKFFQKMYNKLKISTTILKEIIDKK